MNLSISEYLNVIALIVTSLFAIVGWWQTFALQKKLIKYQSDEIRRSDDFSTIYQFIDLCQEVLALIDLKSKAIQGRNLSQDADNELYEKLATLRPLLTNAKDLAQHLDNTGDTEQMVEDVVSHLCSTVGHLCLALTGSENYDIKEDTSEANNQFSIAREHLRNLERGY